jgi:spermidine/putrescine-binding protein
LSPSASAFSLSSDETRRIIRVSSYIEQEQQDWKELANAFIQAFEELSMEASTSTVISI